MVDFTRLIWYVFRPVKLKSTKTKKVFFRGYINTLITRPALTCKFGFFKIKSGYTRNKNQTAIVFFIPKIPEYEKTCRIATVVFLLSS